MWLSVQGLSGKQPPNSHIESRLDGRGNVTDERDGGIGALLIRVLVVLALHTSHPMPTDWHAPRWWLPQAVCIHEHEGAWNDATGNGYWGGMQFELGTWASVGGIVRPDRASIREQLYRSWLVYLRDGRRWWIGDGGEWGSSARSCGLR